MKHLGFFIFAMVLGVSNLAHAQNYMRVNQEIAQALKGKNLYHYKLLVQKNGRWMSLGSAYVKSIEELSEAHNSDDFDLPEAEPGTLLIVEEKYNPRIDEEKLKIDEEDAIQMNPYDGEVYRLDQVIISIRRANSILNKD
ncbi:MAG TPA: hypothetical protein PKC21_08040 [Oligoflexia bacterium]|nr:hypothetical protein [Oligoflexia bacterium]HMR25288.1 hypothetical protein [Oligoflexia bacterium]